MTSGIAMASTAALLSAAIATGEEPAAPLVFQDHKGGRVVVGVEDADAGPRLILASDRGGSRFSRRWLARMSALEPRLRIIEVAHLAGVPAPVRPLVRRAFRGSPSVLLDWKGALASSYGFRPRRVNVYLIDSNGRLRLAESGGDSDEDLARVVTSIEQAVAEASSP
jgi:hypothetical protein